MIVVSKGLEPHAGLEAFPQSWTLSASHAASFRHVVSSSRLMMSHSSTALSSSLWSLTMERSQSRSTLNPSVVQPIRDVLGGNGGSGSSISDDALQLGLNLSSQLSRYAASIATADPDQLEVIRLHADCINAVFSGRDDLLEHETRNLIVDGLNLAMEVAGGSSG